MTPAIRYRLARTPDEQAIAALHADSWRRSFRGMMSDAFLDDEVGADRAAVWRERFAKGVQRDGTLTIVAEWNGAVVGFSHTISQADPAWGALLDNLHVRHDARRRGIGRRLTAETAAWLHGREHGTGLHLWTQEANATSRALYESLGGRITGHMISTEGGGSTKTLRYWWPDLSPLLRYLPQERQPLT
jgi:ribosomal protein S18 acetylase RimI-like enzyme